MKMIIVSLTLSALAFIPFNMMAQTSKGKTISKTKDENLYIDVHQLEPGKVKYEDVAKAHAKDLATEKKYGVRFIKYWVDEDKGLIYCLSSAPDSESIRKTHAEAHGLLPRYIYKVTDGSPSTATGEKNYFLDVHYLGAGNVTAKDVAGAHEKDLATEKKYGVNFINYWVDEKNGVVMCLSQAKDSNAVIQTHKEAHGLLPAYVLKVKGGE
jgi:Nickel responsive protein SCO4226-like